MGAPHNKNRYGETWPSYRIEHGLEILEKLKPWVVISGGWAWHFMSPANHTEYKHAHDHKDIDLFIHPKNVPQVMQVLLAENFQKVWTRYDHLPSEENFRRYEKIKLLDTGKEVRVTIDFFESKEIEFIEVNGWKVVEPKTLLSFYSNIHSSDKCWAVQAAIKLIAKNKQVVGNNLLIEIPK